MAGYQATGREETTDEWIARRNREVYARERGDPSRGEASASSDRRSDPYGIAELRRQQAQFRQGVLEEDRRNRWMAAPALAPAAVVMGLEGLAWAGARSAAAGTYEATEFPLYQVTRNQIAGNRSRDTLMNGLRAEGRMVKPEVVKPTPFGGRRVDLDVWHEGKNVRGVEVKKGLSRYLASQRAKDFWLKHFGNYIVNVVRDK
jgi:hypothetical protein